MTNRTDQMLVLKDNRRLGYAEWGEPSGKTVFLFVGGSSRLVRPLDNIPNLRLITIDRPGIGLSDFQPKRSLLDLPSDILHLADALGTKEFGIVGISQGVPSALACAYKIRNRLTAVSVVSSLVPVALGEEYMVQSGPATNFTRLAKSFPPAFRLQSELATWMVRLSAKWTFQQVLKTLPQIDRSIFQENPQLTAMFVEDLKETYRQGGRGSAQEGLLAYRPWGFRLEEIRTKVYIWHGENDRSAPVSMGSYLIRHIPNSEATFLPDEGHFLGLKHWPKITAQLLDHPRG